MAPKARDIDQERVQALLAQKTPRREIARLLNIPESTLRYHLKQVPPQGHPCRPMLSTGPEMQEGLHKGDQGPPPLYVHPGISDDSEESPVGGEDIEGIHQGIPVLPHLGIPQGDESPPTGTLSPHLVEALTAAWPDLHAMLTWWQERHQAGPDVGEKLERVTYHVAPRWIEAVRREADRTRESYAAVVNRALRQYFAGRET